MSLSKEVKIDKIEIMESGIIQVRQVTRIIEDDNLLSSLYYRWSLTPGQDISTQEQKVQAIANAAWTPEIIAAYEASTQAPQAE